MSGWFDDWANGHLDCWTAFSGWLDGRESPSDRASKECGYTYDEFNACEYDKTKKYSREEYDRQGRTF